MSRRIKEILLNSSGAWHLRGQLTTETQWSSSNGGPSPVISSGTANTIRACISRTYQGE